MSESEATEDELLMVEARRWNGPYEPRCADCGWVGGAYLLGPVALQHALAHTTATHHHVRVFQGVE